MIEVDRMVRRLGPIQRQLLADHPRPIEGYTAYWFSLVGIAWWSRPYVLFGEKRLRLTPFGWLVRRRLRQQLQAAK